MGTNSDVPGDRLSRSGEDQAQDTNSQNYRRANDPRSHASFSDNHWSFLLYRGDVQMLPGNKMLRHDRIAMEVPEPRGVLTPQNSRNLLCEVGHMLVRQRQEKMTKCLRKIPHMPGSVFLSLGNVYVTRLRIAQEGGPARCSFRNLVNMQCCARVCGAF